MSIQVMTAVWKHSKERGGSLLVLLALADWADDSGISYPTIPTLAKKSRTSVRQAQRIVQELAASGTIDIVEGTISGRSVKRYYRIRGDILSHVADDAEQKGDIYDAKRVTFTTPKGDIGRSYAESEPSLTVSDPSMLTRPLSLPSKAPRAAKQSGVDVIDEHFIAYMVETFGPRSRPYLGASESEADYVREVIDRATNGAAFKRAISKRRSVRNWLSIHFRELDTKAAARGPSGAYQGRRPEGARGGTGRGNPVYDLERRAAAQAERERASGVSGP